jgi:hypothetical protein
LPLDGQGEALPEFVAGQAQWIFPNKLYLYHGDRGSAPMAMTRGVELTDGTLSLGVDASMLASKLGLTIEQLFAHNSAGTPPSRLPDRSACLWRHSRHHVSLSSRQGRSRF